MKSALPESVGRYRIDSELGRGGMGVVYKAFDPQLERYVALKVVEREKANARFLLEARAQAKVDHDHVCKIYEAAEAGDALLISMQWIRGCTLSAASGAMTLEQKLLVMRQVCLALHEAHKQGLIHRDIKPNNIMVEQTDEGAWKSFVMDFGLVKTEDHGITATGAIIGTPSYMSPEQALGDIQKIDRRSDVYSLGATMYEILTGHRPFEGDSVLTILMKLIHEEPSALRKLSPSLPQDVETIVMKCLEKDPERRYESAKALAEDLGRYLSGDPIVARASSFVYRASRKARKHKKLVAAGSLALLVIIALAAAGFQARSTARKQAAAAQQFGSEVKELEAVMRFAHLAPLHNIRPHLELLNQRLKQIENQMQSLGKAANGPGNYALGRGHLASQQYEKAFHSLKRAWDGGYRNGSVAYSLGLTMGHLYSETMKTAQTIGNPELRKKREQEIDNTYRLPALQLLQEAKHSTSEAPEYIEALLHFWNRRYEAAISKSEEALQKYPWLFEAKALVGEAYLMMSVGPTNQGDNDRAIQILTQASNAYRDTLQIAPSYPGGHVGLCKVSSEIMSLQLYQTATSPESEYANAIRACHDALKADPQNADAYVELSYAHTRWAEYLRGRGENVTQTINTAIGAAGRAIALTPMNATALLNLGYAYLGKGDDLAKTGKDPRETLEKSIRSYRKASELIPSSSAPHNDVGSCYLIVAEYEKDHGLDPQKSFALAARSFEKAVALNPSVAGFYFNLGSVYSAKAKFELLTAAPCETSPQEALVHYKKSIEMNPNFLYTYPYLAEAYLLLAECNLKNGQSPALYSQQAEPYLDRALQSGFDDAFTYALSAKRELLEAQWNWKTSAETDFRQAEEYLKKADSNRIEVQEVTVRLFRSKAEWLLEQGKSPAGSLAKSLAGVDTILRINPGSVEAEAIKGVLLLLRGRSESRETRAETAKKAAALLRNALTANKNLLPQFGSYLTEAQSALIEQTQQRFQE